MALYEVTCVATLLLTLLTAESRSQIDVCGVAPLNTRNSGGQVANEGSWPWWASVGFLVSLNCGGSLINNEWVLTAACCVSGFSNPTVILGRHFEEGSNPNEVSRSVSQIIVHPDYNPSTKDNNIALLRLSSPVTFTYFIRPVCLAASNSTFFAGTKMWLTHLGSTGPVTPNKLMDEQVPVVGNRKCTCKHEEGLITENMICAGGIGACVYESGGPMMRKQNGRWVQAGVTSFSTCGLLKSPNIYTRVSRYQSWINSIITTNQPGFITFTSTGTDSDQSVTCGGPTTATATITAAPALTTRRASRTPSPSLFSSDLFIILMGLSIFFFFLSIYFLALYVSVRLQQGLYSGLCTWGGRSTN